ncbi:MAG: metallophosphoesterase [Rubricella sp.]
MARVYAIGDIHGHLEKLRAAHRLIEADRARCGDDAAPVIHTGDLVDRGPDSKGVLEWLIEKTRTDSRQIVLKGNHDRMLEWFLRDEPRHDPRLYAGLTYLSEMIGGRATLLSYDVDPTAPFAEVHAEARARVPDEHCAFLASLPLWHACGECLFVHAGIRPGCAMAEQTEEDLVWIRDDFIFDTRDHGALVVHGHTPVDAVEHHGNRVNLDTGAAFGGPLSAVVIEGRQVWLLTASGRRQVA